MKLLKKEWLFFIFLGLFFLLYFNLKPSLRQINSFIDWSTIRALFALLLVTTGIKLSNVFDYISLKTVNKFKTERIMAFVFVIFSAILSMFLTNDITLFIMVPLTLAFSSQIKNDLTKLVIFEAIAVNVGSALTPFGNPQNIFLFRQMNVSVLDFTEKMFVLFVPTFLLLLIFVYFMFPSKKLLIHVSSNTQPDKTLFFVSLSLFLIFILSLEYSYVRYSMILTVIVYLVLKKEVFKKFDYFLILTFIIMFIDFGMLSKLDIIKESMANINLDFYNVLNISIVLSEIISNVPAAIFMSNFSNDYTAIAYGVNIAGNGLLIGSLANIIALRFLKSSKAYIEFHKYSVPYFILSYATLLVILRYFSYF